jgi:sugar phosphate isomerase/epimerase
MKISLQIYSIRDAGDFDTQLALAKSCGFEWVETVATHGLNARDFSRAIDKHGLKVSSMHASLDLLESGGLPMLADACKLTGCPLIIMPWLPMGLRSGNAAGWKAMSERLSRIGDRVNALGLRFAYHNHEWEFLRYEGQTALEWIFSAASPEQLGWEADLGWVHRAGANAAHWLDLFANRLVAIHAKDIAEPGTAADEDGWTTLGKGIVPWPDLLARLKPQVDLFVFEHDRPVDFARTLSESHSFMSQHLY